MFFKNFRGKLFETVKDTQNLRQRYRKPLRRGFQIIFFMFNLNVKQALANQICCTHNMCIITQNDRKCQNASKCLLRNGTESNDISSHRLTRAYLKWGRGVNFQLFPLLGPPCILTGPNWHMHNLAMGPTI